MTRQSRKILPVGSANELDSEELSSPTSVIIDGETHLIYVGATKEGTVNTILSAKGNLNVDDLPAPLPASERRRHIHV